MSRSARRSRLSPVAALLALFCVSNTVEAQVVDLEGYITAENWLALGPIANPFACSGNAVNLLSNHVAPESIQCLYPELGDNVEIDYDQAGSTGHHPAADSDDDGNPDWQQFSDGGVDCDLDMDATAAGGLDRHMFFVATYVEFEGDEPVDIQICANSDDDLQVWWDGSLALNVAACRPRGGCATGACNDLGTVTVTPGTHRIMFGVWENGGGYGGSLRLLDAATGAPITEDSEDWVFLGIEPDELPEAADGPCDSFAERSVTLPDCNEDFESVGPLGVTITKALEGADGADTVTVEEIVNGNGVEIGAVSDGGTSEDVVVGDDGLDPVTGAVQEYFVLGPISNPGGAAPGLDAIRAEYLTISDEEVDELEEGDEVEDVDGTLQTVRRLSVNNGDALDYNQTGGAGDNIMHYAWTQLTLTETKLISIAVNADDSVQVQVNGEEVTIHNGGQGFGGVGSSEWGGLVELDAGTHTILTKVYEGGGGHGVRTILREVTDEGVGPGGIDCEKATEIAPGQTGVGGTFGDADGLACNGADQAPAAYYAVEGTGLRMRAETCNPVFIYDTWLSVLDGDCDPINCLVENDDTCGRQSVVEWDSDEGQVYFIRVSGWNDRRGTYVVRVSDEDTPAAAPIVPLPLEGAAVCVDPSGECDVAATQVIALQVTWENVSRQALADGLDYEVNVPNGLVTFDGSIEGLPIIGTSRAVVCPFPINTGTGQILESQWVMSGPYTHSFGCAGSADLLLGNHIAPDSIVCIAPSIGDTVDYDPEQAVSNAYIGPTEDGMPTWRAVDDGNAQGFIDLNVAAGNNDDVMAWLVTYVENISGDPLDVTFCFGSDDNGQLWVEDQNVINNSVCRGSGGCQDRVPFTLPTGISAIKMAAWDRGGGWNVNLAILDAGGLAIQPDDGLLRFLGANAPDGYDPPDCPECDAVPVSNLTCTFVPAGLGGVGIRLDWENPEQQDPLTPTRIQVNGKQVATVDTDATTVTLNPGQLPTGEAFVVTVVHCGGIPTSCNPFNTIDNGAIADSSWLALGPFATPVGCDGNVDLLTANAIGPEHHIACEFPESGDVVEGYEIGDPFDPAAPSSTTGLHPNAAQTEDGDPVWTPFRENSGDGDLNFDGHVGDVNEHVLYTATYVENTTDETLELTMCVGSDDDGQWWIDDSIVDTLAVCRGRGFCQNQLPFRLPPGSHVIKMGVWEQGGGFGGSVALRDLDGLPILDPGGVEDRPWRDVDDLIAAGASPLSEVIVFHGRNKPDNFDVECSGLPIGAVSDLACTLSGSDVEVSWLLPENAEADRPISIQVNGQEIDSISGDSEEYTVGEGDLGGADVVTICVQTDGGPPVCCGLFVGTELYINCGGPEFEDADGRVWQRDTIQQPSSFLSSANTNTAAFAAWQGGGVVNIEADELVADNAIPEEIFPVERWSNGPVEYTIPVNPDATYEVQLFFMEACCSDGCLSNEPDADACAAIGVDGLPPEIDPQAVSASCRVFDILINGEIVQDQFSQSVLAACVGEVAPGQPSYGIAVSLVFDDVEPDPDGNLVILIEDLGGGNPPENASIKGICLRESGAPSRERNCDDDVDNDDDGLVDCADPDCAGNDACPDGDNFVRGDPNSTGAIDLTDGVNILNFLFLGGAAPTCMDSADTDDTGDLAISDAVIIFGWLFQGGRPPSAPTPTATTYPVGDCGPDTTEDGLDCAVPGDVCL